MAKILSQATQNQLTNKRVQKKVIFKINSIDYSDYLLSWSIESSRDYGSASGTFTLKNQSGIFGEGGSQKINIGDVVELIEQFNYTADSFKRFYGIVNQRSITKSATEKTITIVCLDYISILQFTDIDLEVKGNKIEVSNEILTPIFLPNPNDSLAQLFNFANDSLSDSPKPIIIIRNKNTSTEDPQFDGFEIYYNVGQLKLGFPLNAKYNYDLVAKSYYFYTTGVYIEDILESILKLADGYGNFLFGEPNAQSVIDNHLTTTFLVEEGRLTDTLTPNLSNSTITIKTTLTSAITAGDITINVTSTEGFPSSGLGNINGDYFTWTGKTDTTLTGIPSSGSNSLNGHPNGSYVEYETTYSSGQVWYLSYSNIQSSLIAANFDLPSGASINYVDKKFGRIILNTPASLSDTITCNTNYQFKTLQCVDEKTEALTKNGWKTYDKLTLNDELLTLNSETKKAEWNKIERISIDNDYKGNLIHLYNRSFDALVTPNHKWITGKAYRLFHSKNLFNYNFTETKNFNEQDYIIRNAEEISNSINKYEDNFVKLLGWYVTKGSLYRYKYNNCNKIGYISITQSKKKYFNEIENLLKNLSLNYSISYKDKQKESANFNLTGNIVKSILNEIPNKVLTKQFILNLSSNQRTILYETLLKGDGSYICKYGKNEVFYSTNVENIESFEFLCNLMGFSTSLFVDDRQFNNLMIKNKKVHKNKDCYMVRVLKHKTIRTSSLTKDIYEYSGTIWCPTIKNNSWLMRRNGKTTFTGNSTGVELNRIVFRSREVANRFDAIKKLRSYLAPNYIIRTIGDNKIWASYLSQKVTADYTLQLDTTIHYLEDEDLYTRSVFYRKNKNPTNLMFKDGVDFVTTGLSYKATATMSELSASREEEGYYIYGSSIAGVGKITANTIAPVVYLNDVPIDNTSHQLVAQSVIVEVTTRTETTTEGGGK